MKHSSADLAEEVSLVLAFEGVVPTQDHVKDNAHRPHVSCKATVVFLLNYFWSHIRRGSTKDLQLLVWRGANAKTEVNQFDIISIVYKYIFKLEISVAYVLTVKIPQALTKLLEKEPGLVLS